MEGRKEAEPQKEPQRQPAAQRVRKAAIVRVLQALKRRLDRSRRHTETEESEHRINERMMAQWTRKVGLLTVAIVLCSFASVVVSAFQWHEMHTGGVDTHDLAIAAKSQASVLVSQLALSEAETIEREEELRARITISPDVSCPSCSRVTDFPNGSHQIDMSIPNFLNIAVRNSGQTVANNFTITKNWYPYIMGTHLPDRFDCPIRPRSQAPNAFAVTIHEGSPLNAGETVFDQTRLNPDEVINLARTIRGEIGIYLCGHVKFKDIFDKDHDLLFIYSYDPSPAAGNAPFGVVKIVER